MVVRHSTFVTVVHPCNSSIMQTWGGKRKRCWSLKRQVACLAPAKSLLLVANMGPAPATGHINGCTGSNPNRCCATLSLVDCYMGKVKHNCKSCAPYRVTLKHNQLEARRELPSRFKCKAAECCVKPWQMYQTTLSYHDSTNAHARCHQHVCRMHCTVFSRQ